MNQLYSNITGVILSGGKNSRMQTNKALLKIDGQTLIEKIFDLFSSLFKEIIISTNEPELYPFINALKVKDEYIDLGPLAGIHSALKVSKTEKIFALSCDTPFITKSLIDHLINIKTEQPIVLPKTSKGIQFLCGIYSKEILPVADKVLSVNTEAKKIYEKKKSFRFSLSSFVERVGAEIIDVEFERFYFNDMFFNINTPEDLEYASSRLF